MAAESIEKIKEAEQQAAAIEKEAIQQRAERMERAGREAQELREHLVTEAEQSAMKQKEAAEKAAEAERSRYLEQTGQEAERLKLLAEQNREKTVAAILEKIV